MKANELRIGNLVEVLGKTRSVLGISNRLRPDVGYFEFEGLKTPLKGFHLKPIPLTEERLVKLGFDNSFGMQWYKDGVRVSMATPTTMLFWRDEFNEDEVITLKDKYVHTLQNAWVLITGEELTTNN